MCVAASNKGVAQGTSRSPGKGPTVAELREECKQRGLKNYSKLNKKELILFLKGTSLVQSRKIAMIVYHTVVGIGTAGGPCVFGNKSITTYFPTPD